MDRLRAQMRFLEPWYAAYGLMGFLIAGLVPILLPLLVSARGPVAAGAVVAAVSLGGLSAPAWGALADRHRWHKASLAAGLAVAAAAMAILPLTNQPAVWFFLALLLGAGSTGAATVANLFVVEAHPREEWDERIGWLQTFYGVGQTLGLLAAAIMSGWDMRAALGTAAAVCAAAALIGWFTAGGIRIQNPPQKPALMYPPRHAEGSILSPQRLFHSPGRRALGRIGAAARTPFGVFLLTWLLAIGGSAAVFSQYPILMQRVFGIGPAASSLGFGAAAGLGLLLYAPAGRWSDRTGKDRVYRIGLGVRFLALAVMAGLTLGRFGAAAGFGALPAFAFVVLAWSLLSVSGTAITAALWPQGEGEGMGLFNAANALANILGAAIGGWFAGRLGYASLIVLAAAGVAGGWLLSIRIRPAALTAIPKEG